MINNYIITALKQFWQNRVYTLIILLGWSVALFVAYNTLVFVLFQFSFDKQHEHRDRTYIIQTHLKDFQLSKFRTPYLLSDALKNEIPEIEKVTRYGLLYRAKLNLGEEVIRINNIFAADENIFDVFHLPMKNNRSPKGLLTQKNSILISEKMANKFFGDEEVIGKNLTIILEGKEFVFTITGVFQNTPHNSTFRPEFLTNIDASVNGVFVYSNEKTKEDIKENWGQRDWYTYIVLPKDHDAVATQNKLADLATKYLPEKAEIEWRLESLSSMHVDYYLDFTILYILLIMGGLVLLVAGANYIVLGSAISINRSKEIGLRKLMGASPLDIKKQFLVESILISVLSIPISIILFKLFLPFTLPILELPSEFVDLHFINYLPLFVLLSVICGALSGIYVSFKLSGIQVIQVLKIRYLQLSSKSLFRKVLIAFQLIIIITMLSFVFTIKLQTNYGINKNQGFNKDDIMIVSFGSRFPQYQAYIDQISTHPNIIVAGAAMFGPPAQTNMSMMVPRVDDASKEIRMEVMAVDFNFMEALNFKLKEGRYFSRKFGSDPNTLILNQTAVDELGITDPIGKTVMRKKIIGVVEDFHLHSIHKSITPITIKMARQKYISQIAIKYKAGTEDDIIPFLREKWDDLQSDRVFKYRTFDESLSDLYDFENMLSSLISIIVLIISLVALSGLIGLTLFMIKYKQKEVGLRKLFGAPIRHIRKSIIKEFSILLAIAWLISLLPSWFIIQAFLESYAYKTPLNIWIFLLPLLITAIVVFMSILIYINKLARTNIIEVLKDE